MIAIAIAAMLAAATPMSTAPAATAAGLSLPHIPRPKLPKFRLPHLPKRERAGEPMAITGRRLVALVRDQEAWYADHGVYAANSGKAGVKSEASDAAFAKVQVQMIYADKKGWAAMASHPDAAGKSCVIYVGNRNSLPMVPRTRADATDATQEAKPACDK